MAVALAGAGAQVTPAAPQADKFEKLVGELIAAKKSDAELLEAITLATLSRLPTDSEPERPARRPPPRSPLHSLLH